MGVATVFPHRDPVVQLFLEWLGKATPSEVQECYARTFTKKVRCGRSGLDDKATLEGVRQLIDTYTFRVDWSRSDRVDNPKRNRVRYVPRDPEYVFSISTIGTGGGALDWEKLWREANNCGSSFDFRYHCFKKEVGFQVMWLAFHALSQAGI